MPRRVTRTRVLAVVACVTLGPVLPACSSGPGASSTTVRPGCPTAVGTVHLALSDRVPVPVVRIPPGDCVAVTVPRSPFPHTPTEPIGAVPADRLRLVSDSLLANGTRAAYFLALTTGAVTVSSTVSVQTDRAVPEWSGLVIVV